VTKYFTTKSAMMSFPYPDDKLLLTTVAMFEL